MIHQDTVFVMNKDETWMSVGYTFSYVTGRVGCSLNYEAIFGSKCQGYQANMELHHTTNTRSHHGFCFVENPINTMLEKIVHPTPPPNVDSKYVDSRYSAFSMEECIRNLWEVKLHEDRI